MASTNKTTNYELSQYIGTDKPTYLGDYNGDMLKIDTAIKANADNISSASSSATSAYNTAQTAATNASSALTSANNASAAATSALNKALENEAKIEKFNLTVFDTITSFTKVSGGGTISNQSSVQVARNSDGSLAKIYGILMVDNVTSTGSITFNTSLRPQEAITINCGAIRVNAKNGVVSTVSNVSYTIGTDGKVTVSFAYAYNTNEYCRIIFINSLIFIKNFGDVPIPD